MIGKLLVDNINIFEVFGVFAVEGSLNGLLSYPPLKEPEKADWAERDGVDVDLSNPKLDSKTFNMKFAATGVSDMQGFLSLILSKSYHVFDFKQLYIHKKLRLISISDFKTYPMGMVTLELADDFPIESRNIVPGPVLEIDSNLYGFGHRLVSLVGGVEYVLSVNGNINGALNGHILKTFLHDDDWTFAATVEVLSKTNRTSSIKFTAPYTGSFNIDSYYYADTEPRDGTVRLNWYKLEEYGLQDFNYNVNHSFISQRGYLIDGVDLSNYGIMVLEGSNEEILKAPAVKQKLNVSTKAISGSIYYDLKPVKYQSKQVKLSLCLMQWNVRRLIDNYYSFLYDLSKPGIRTFEFEGKQFNFYYKSSSVEKLLIGGKIWLNFSLNLEFTKEL